MLKDIFQKLTYKRIGKDEYQNIFEETAVPTRTWTKDEIKNLLLTNDKAVLRGILAIYRLQTDDEQKSRETRVKNNIGFSGYDANFMSGMAKLLQSGKMLTQKQIDASRKIILKYAGQLTKISNKEL